MNASSLRADPTDGIVQLGPRAPALAPSILAGHGRREGDHTGDRHRVPMAISDAFVADILKPYRKHATYLKSAEITQFSEKALRDSNSEEILVTGIGKFSIPESCYIDDTGHFNAVEFNICYNQLAYVVFAKCVDAGLMHQLWSANLQQYIPSFSEFKRQQLPAMLIVRVDAVRFFKQMKSDDFNAKLTVDRMAIFGQAGFFFTSITFSDCEGVKASGSVVLAFQPDLTQLKAYAT